MHTVPVQPRVRRTALFWSGGKDAALALVRLRASATAHPDLLVVATQPDGAAVVHDVSVELLQAQADRLSLPLRTVTVAADLSDYAEAMRALADELREDGYDAVAFGDLDCSGGAALRRATFAPSGLEVLEPLAGLSSAECMDEFLASGLRALTIVVDADVLDAAHLGIAVDRQLIAALPEGVDPCGEFGEFHSFVHDGPGFAAPVGFELAPIRSHERHIRTTAGTRTFRYLTRTPIAAG